MMLANNKTCYNLQLNLVFLFYSHMTAAINLYYNNNLVCYPYKKIGVLSEFVSPLQIKTDKRDGRTICICLAEQLSSDITKSEDH